MFCAAFSRSRSAKKYRRSGLEHSRCAEEELLGSWLCVFVLRCRILGSIPDSTLPRISQLTLSPFPLFSDAHTYVRTRTARDGVPAVCVRVTAHACVHVRPSMCVCVWVWASLCVAACGFSCRGVDHGTAVNLKGKLINWSTSDSSTSSPQNGLCSL